MNEYMKLVNKVNESQEISDLNMNYGVALGYLNALKDTSIINCDEHSQHYQGLVNLYWNRFDELEE